MIKIVNIVGVRPQFIKMAALQRAFSNCQDINSIIIHTGQHYDENMSEIFFKELEIPAPHYNLQINQLERREALVKMKNAIKVILVEEKPAMVIVFGDTNSTLSGALAAKELDIPVAHIEAGLRSDNLLMPEEINRIETDKISDLLFAPSKSSYDYLVAGNNSKKNILSGDIMLDAFTYYSLESKSTSSPINLPATFILCSLHREQLVSNPALLAQVITALNYINEIIPIIMTAHPRTFRVLNNLAVPCTFRIIEPQSYFTMLHLLKKCSLVITDSGGLQKEAYFAKKGCLVIREESEWKELINAGVNILTGYQTDQIIQSFLKIRNATLNFSDQFYGQGNAADIMIKEIRNYFN